MRKLKGGFMWVGVVCVAVCLLLLFGGAKKIANVIAPLKGVGQAVSEGAGSIVDNIDPDLSATADVGFGINLLAGLSDQASIDREKANLLKATVDEEVRKLNITNNDLEQFLGGTLESRIHDEMSVGQARVELERIKNAAERLANQRVAEKHARWMKFLDVLTVLFAGVGVVFLGLATWYGGLTIPERARTDNLHRLIGPIIRRLPGRQGGWVVTSLPRIAKGLPFLLLRTENPSQVTSASNKPGEVLGDTEQLAWHTRKALEGGTGAQKAGAAARIAGRVFGGVVDSVGDTAEKVGKGAGFFAQGVRGRLPETVEGALEGEED